MIPFFCNFHAGVQVIFKFFFQQLGDAFVIQECIHFKIQHKTADIHIGGAYRCHFSVDGQHLGMDEPSFILINLYAGLQKFPQIGHAGPVNEEMIGIAGNDDTHIQPRQGRHPQGFKNAVIGHEIRCGQIDMTFRFIHHFKETIADIVPLGIGAAGNDLRRHPVKLLSGREVIFADLRFPLFGGKIPVLDKAHLHLIHGIALKPQMGISPGAISFGDAQIFIPYIETADIADFAVDDSQLAVIAVIQTHDETRQKGCRIAAGFPQVIKEIGRQKRIADAVIQHADFHALRRFFRQFFHQTGAQCISPPDIIFQMDMLFGIADIFDQRIEFILPVIKIVDLIIKGQPAAAVQVHVDQICHIGMIDQRFMVAEDLLLLSVFPHRLHIVMVNRAVIFFLFQKHLLTPAVAPENHINKEAQHRNKQQHQQPCPCAGGISAFKEHDQPGQDDIAHQNDQSDQNQPVEKTIRHIPPPFFFIKKS